MERLLYRSVWSVVCFDGHRVEVRQACGGQNMHIDR